MTRCLIVTGALLTAYASQLTAQDPRIDSVFATWSRKDGPGCIAGVRHNGNTIHLKAYGMANLEYGVPLTVESISETGSVAKQFTATTLLLLQRDGKLSLDDEVRKYLPEVPDFGSRITLRHLLTHTSGIRDQWALFSLAGWPPGTQVNTIDQIVDLVSHQRRLNFPPGQLYLYSNTGYTLLAAVVRRVTGQSLADWSREHLFVPLGMRNTQWRDDYRRIVPGRATAYSRGAGGAWMQDMPFTMVYGNGGLLTTVPDLLIWNDALSSGQAPLSAELVHELETPGRLNDGTDAGYGLGLGIATWRGAREISHGGATAGYRTQLSRWPERRLSVAILCNDGEANPAATARQVAQKVLGLPTEDVPPSPPVAIAVTELQPLAGAWRDTISDRIITFAVSDGKFTVSGGGPFTTLTHLGQLRFWSMPTDELQFERVTSGWRVIQHQGGTREYFRQGAVDSTRLVLNDYVGRYYSDELNVTYTVSLADGRLNLRRAWEMPLRLSPVYPDGFRAGGSSARFVRDGAGRVTGFRVFAGRALDVRFTRLSDSENGK